MLKHIKENQSHEKEYEHTLATVQSTFMKTLKLVQIIYHITCISSYSSNQTIIKA